MLLRDDVRTRPAAPQHLDPLRHGCRDYRLDQDERGGAVSNLTVPQHGRDVTVSSRDKQRPCTSSEYAMRASFGQAHRQWLRTGQVAQPAVRQRLDRDLAGVLGDFPSVSMAISHYLFRARSEGVSTPPFPSEVVQAGRCPTNLEPFPSGRLSGAKRSSRPPGRQKRSTRKARYT